MTKEELLLNPENPQLQAIATEIDRLLENAQPGHLRVAVLNDFCTIKSLEEDLSGHNSQVLEEQEHANRELIERIENEDLDPTDADDLVTIIRLASPTSPDVYWIMTAQRLAIATERNNDRKATIAGYAKEFSTIEGLFFDWSDKYDQITRGNQGEEMVAHRMQVALNFFLAPDIPGPEPE
jgi:hypothetical protein